MGPDDLVSTRLRNQKLTRTALRKPADVVAWLGAVQAQDFATAKWGLGLRAHGLTDAVVERAFNEGAILRTHAMRPTWHFVAPADIRWIQALTAARVHRFNGPYYRKSELDPATLSKSRRVLERALAGHTHLTRAEIGVILSREGIQATGLRLALLMMHAELEQVICSGVRREKQFTYALLEERAPARAAFDRESALAELAKRYFTSHGPATVKDFVWWSGLTVGDAKTGIAMTKPVLTSATVDDLAYWFAPSRSSPPPAAPTAHLLPNYDEYSIAYKDREAIRAASYSDLASGRLDQYRELPDRRRPIRRYMAPYSGRGARRRANRVLANDDTFQRALARIRDRGVRPLHAAANRVGDVIRTALMSVFDSAFGLRSGRWSSWDVGRWRWELVVGLRSSVFGLRS